MGIDDCARLIMYEMINYSPGIKMERSKNCELIPMIGMYLFLKIEQYIFLLILISSRHIDEQYKRRLPQYTQS